MRAHKEQWLRPLARHPPHILRGDNGKTGLAGASPNNTGDDARLFELGCLKSKSLRQPPLIPANAGIQGWMPAGARPREGGDGHERML
jgi:hypothetical protein